MEVVGKSYSGKEWIEGKRISEGKEGKRKY